MWQSAALVGALSLGGSAPAEFGTCWAWLWPTWIPEAVAVIAATEAPLIKVRRAIIFSHELFDVDEATHSAERSEGATCEVAVAAQHRHPRLREREIVSHTARKGSCMSVVSPHLTVAAEAPRDTSPGGRPPGSTSPQTTTADRPLATAKRSQTAVPRRLRRYLSLADFEKTARRRLPRMIYGFIAGAVETDAALRDNR